MHYTEKACRVREEKEFRLCNPLEKIMQFPTLWEVVLPRKLSFKMDPRRRLLKSVSYLSDYCQSPHACAASDRKCTIKDRKRAIGMSSIGNIRDSIRSNLCPPAQINRMFGNVVWEMGSTQLPFVLKVRKFYRMLYTVDRAWI